MIGASSLQPILLLPSSWTCFISKCQVCYSYLMCHDYFTDVFHLSFTGLIFLVFLRKRMFAPELGGQLGVGRGQCYFRTPRRSSGILGDVEANPLACSEMAWVLWNIFSWKCFQRMLKIHCSLFSPVGSICVPTWPGNTKRSNVKCNVAHSKINEFSGEQGKEKTTVVWV